MGSALKKKDRNWNYVPILIDFGNNGRLEAPGNISAVLIDRAALEEIAYAMSSNGSTFSSSGSPRLSQKPTFLVTPRGISDILVAANKSAEPGVFHCANFSENHYPT